MKCRSKLQRRPNFDRTKSCAIVVAYITNSDFLFSQLKVCITSILLLVSKKMLKSWVRKDLDHIFSFHLLFQINSNKVNIKFQHADLINNSISYQMTNRFENCLILLDYFWYFLFIWKNKYFNDTMTPQLVFNEKNSDHVG